MQYGQLINRAFYLTWQYKSLWIFGFFAGMGMNTDFHIGQSDRQYRELAEALSRHEFTITPEQLMALFGVGMIILLLFMLTRLIASPALIDGVNKIARGGTYRFNEAFSRGVDFFWREFLLVLFTFGMALAILITGAAAVVGAVLITPYLLIIGIPMALFIFLGGAFVLFNVVSLGERAMVVRDIGIRQSLDEGYVLLKRNVGPTFVFALINVGLMLGISLLVIMVFAMIGLPFLPLFTSDTVSTVTKVLVGLVVFGPLSIFFGGWSNSFYHALYTLFYFELVEPQSSAGVPTPPLSGYPPPPSAG